MIGIEEKQLKYGLGSYPSLKWKKMREKYKPLPPSFKNGENCKKGEFILPRHHLRGY